MNTKYNWSYNKEKSEMTITNQSNHVSITVNEDTMGTFGDLCNMFNNEDEKINLFFDGCPNALLFYYNSFTNDEDKAYVKCAFNLAFHTEYFNKYSDLNADFLINLFRNIYFSLFRVESSRTTPKINDKRRYPDYFELIQNANVWYNSKENGDRNLIRVLLSHIDQFKPQIRNIIHSLITNTTLINAYVLNWVVSTLESENIDINFKKYYLTNNKYIKVDYIDITLSLLNIGDNDFNSFHFFIRLLKQKFKSMSEKHICEVVLSEMLERKGLKFDLKDIFINLYKNFMLLSNDLREEDYTNENFLQVIRLCLSMDFDILHFNTLKEHLYSGNKSSACNVLDSIITTKSIKIGDDFKLTYLDKEDLKKLEFCLNERTKNEHFYPYYYSNFDIFSNVFFKLSYIRKEDKKLIDNRIIAVNFINKIDTVSTFDFSNNVIGIPLNKHIMGNTKKAITGFLRENSLLGV